MGKVVNCMIIKILRGVVFGEGRQERGFGGVGKMGGERMGREWIFGWDWWAGRGNGLGMYYMVQICTMPLMVPGLARFDNV